ncbi:PadR family transcriptional regulator [Anaerosporobacter sp.]|uniref:PadR family transcriptional regulator n=1 Tax=Anaerosporobacter sp. TaxID=1872529 RepID=UPI00286EF903|nr:PadR family transcriptional regulator [Anaerosporobacter sp.]
MSTLLKFTAPLVKLLILNLLSQKSSYGYEITTFLRDVYPLNESSIYTALKQLTEQQELIYSIQIVGGRLRKYYTITPAGKITLEEMNPQCQKQFSSILALINTDSQIPL